jgi:hypothetical protein
MLSRARMPGPWKLLAPAAVAVAPLLVAGCTSWKLAQPAAATVMPFDAAPPAAARVCVVRTSILALAVTFPTHDDGVLVGATRGQSFFCYLAEPGEHEIAIDADETEHAHLTAKAGESYFLKEEVDNIFGYVKCRSVWVKADDARDLVASADHLVLVGVPGEEKLPGDAPFAPAHGPSLTSRP